jgi:uncharacterized RDD family membrane protein YckC
MEEKQYPQVLIRVKASFVDVVVLLVLMIIISSIFQNIGAVNDYARIIAFIFVFFLYDPLLISILGGTIGHLVCGLRVRKESNEERIIPFHLAIIRFMVKAFLGWISLLTVTGNKKGRAIHDSIVGSVVVFK